MSSPLDDLDLPPATPGWVGGLVGVVVGVGWLIRAGAVPTAKAIGHVIQQVRQGQGAARIANLGDALDTADRVRRALGVLVEHDRTVIRAVLLHASEREGRWFSRVALVVGQEQALWDESRALDDAYVRTVVATLRSQKPESSLWLASGEARERDLALGELYAQTQDMVGSRVYGLASPEGELWYLSLHCRQQHSTAPAVRELAIQSLARIYR